MSTAKHPVVINRSVRRRTDTINPKEIPFKTFQEKYDSEYQYVLFRLWLKSLDNSILIAAGIKSLKIYAAARRRYYYTLVDANANPMVRNDVFGKTPAEKGTERYLLTIGLCDKMLFANNEKEQEADIPAHLEYSLQIGNRKATLGLVSAEKEMFAKPMVAIFMVVIGKLVDIDVIEIPVSESDAGFLQVLQNAGFKIEGQRKDYHVLVKKFS